MSSKKPKYSIVIPCYNEEKFIGATLESLNNQTYKGLTEIIVVDNNCSDSTSDIAKSFGAKVIKEKIPGVCHARQAGTIASSGEIVISTDADTIYAPGWLDKVDNEFSKSKNIVAVSGPCIYRDGPWWSNPYTNMLFGSSYFYSKIFKHPYYISATNFAFKRSAWEGYDVNLSQGGDEIAMIRQMKNKGAIPFLINNPTLTSSRRLRRGLVYNFFVTFIYYYLLGYQINRIFKKEIIKPAPAYREDEVRHTIYKKILSIFSMPLESNQKYNKNRK